MSESTAIELEPPPTGERKTLLPSTDELNRMIAIAQRFAQARVCANEGEALTKIQLGWEYGIGPGSAATEIYLIDTPSGKRPSPSPLLMRSLVKMRGLGELDLVSTDMEKCVMKVTRTDWAKDRVEQITFGIEDAVAAGLMVVDAKGNVTAGSRSPNYNRYRPDMFLSRATARGWRRHFPELAIGMPYCPEELGADVDQSGAPITPLSCPPGMASVPSSQPMPMQIVTPPEPTAVAAVDAPMPLPTPTAPTGGWRAEASPPIPAPADPFVAGLADIERITLLGEHMNRALALKGLLRLDTLQYKAWLRLHFQAESIRTMTPDDAQRVVVALDRLHKLERLRTEIKITDAQWAVAMTRRGVASMFQLTAQQVQEMVNKLADSLDPFRRKALGLDCGPSGASDPVAVAAGGLGGNGSTPTAGGSPSPARSDAVQRTGPAPSVPPLLIPPALGVPLRQVAWSRSFP